MKKTRMAAIWRLRPVMFVCPCAMILGGVGCSRPPEPPPRTTVRLATGAPGGGFFPVGEGLVRSYARALPGINFEVRVSAGAVANVETLQRGDADLGFAFSDVAYIAFVGRLKGASGPFDHLRGIAVLQLTPVHLVVGKDTGIRAVSDLRGRRIGVGPLGSGTALTAELILRSFGIGAATVRTEMLPFNEAARRLVEGTLDAMFDNAIFPADSVTTATRAGARLMPLTGPPIERLRHEYPFLRVTRIPRDTYPGVTDAIHTIGVDSVLLCRSGLDEALAYELTRRFFDALPSLSSSQGALRFMDLEQAPATPIPLHEGAARYYRERELLR
jgi:TRAP transporter TAXI family solute receptor